MKRGVPVAMCLAALLVLPLPARGAPAQARASTAAIALFASAEESFKELRASGKAQRQRQNFIRVLEAYRRVFEKYPATRQGDESLMRAGELLTLLFRWTGQSGDLNRAQNYYQRLVQTSPKSPLVDDALLAIAYLYLDHFKDPAQAWRRFRDVTLLSPRGDRVAEAKRMLKLLAEYATVDKPIQRADPVDLSCPAPPPPELRAPGARGVDPAGHAAPAVLSPQAPSVISLPPPTVISMPPSSAVGPPPAAGGPQPSKTAPPALAPVSPPALNRVINIRHWSNPEYSRVVIDLDQKTNFYSNLLEDRSGSGKPPRLYIDLFSSLIEERFCKPIVVDDGILHGIRTGQFTPDSVRVVLEIDGLRTYRVFPMQNPFRIVIDVTGGAPGGAAATATTAPDEPAAIVPATPVPVPVTTTLQPETVSAKAAPPEVAPPPSLSVRLTPVTPPPRYTPEPVPDLLPLPEFTAVETTRPAVASPSHPQPAPASSATFSGGAEGGAPAAASPAPSPPAPRGVRQETAVARRSGKPSPSGTLSLARQLGLGVRRVVIDAGHGAHDPGAIGIDGLQEKEVTLDLALRVRDILNKSGYETVLTRDRDIYLPLEERTALANTARGDLFLSLHCNASDNGKLSGVETYFLNLASNVRSMQTAARENSMAVANMSDLQQIVREIQNSKMDESSQFAARIQRSLHDTLHRAFPGIKNLGVKQAPFYVLIGAQMPSVLAEVSFINNKTEGRRLADPAYRQLIAQALVDGVKRYVRTMKTAALAPPRRPMP